MTRLRTDERARVPFALVGVVLLVSSAAYAGVLVARDPIADRTSAERALAIAQTEVHLAIQRAAIAASTAAGTHPLTVPADTPYGALLHGPDSFERYLELLVYLHAQRALRNVSATVGPAAVTASLPRIRTPADARTALARTTIRPIDDGRRLRVTVENVTLRLARGGRTVAARTIPVSVLAATPILALHRRTSTFDRRLDNGPIEGPGLGRRLTARLWAVTQARGLAQYAEVPIANVLPNRHVELQTNAAIVALQRAAFGRADPASERSLAWATARVGIRDLIAASTTAQQQWSQRVLRGPTISTAPPSRSKFDQPTAPDGHRTVGINRSADRALLAVLEPGPGSIRDAVRDAYSIDARLVTDANLVSVTTRGGDRPTNALLVEVERTTTRDVQPARFAGVRVPSQFRTIDSFARRVTVAQRVVRTWRTFDRTLQIVETTTRVYRVSAAVVVRYDPAPAPDRPLSGSVALRRLERAAVHRLIAENGGRSAIVQRALVGEPSFEPVTVSIRPPPDAFADARQAVLATHARTRNLNASVAVSGETPASAPSALAARLADERAALLAAPSRYDGLRSVACVAAKRVYLDAVARELAGDADVVSRTQGALADLLSGMGLTPPPVQPVRVPEPSDSGVAVTVTPAYLPLTEVTPRMAPIDEAYYPLAARNVNLFTVPYGDLADTITAALFPDPPARVDLAVAAHTLAAANTTAFPANESLATNRRDLRADVAAATHHLASAQAAVLSEWTSLSPTASDRLVTATLRRWPTVEGRALALTNGTASSLLARRAASRTDATRAVLAARLRIAVTEARSELAARVPEDVTQRTATLARDLARRSIQLLVEYELGRVVDSAKQRVFKKAMAQLPAGLPIAPVPGSWYATVNVWVVNARGAYHRVEARSVVASPSFGADGLSYVREAGPVAVDVDGDGEPERLGRVEPVAFSVQTVIVVFVPPGPQGVGGTDGNADERSPGWPGPAATRE